MEARWRGLTPFDPSQQRRVQWTASWSCLDFLIKIFPVSVCEPPCLWQDDQDCPNNPQVWMQSPHMAQRAQFPEFLTPRMMPPSIHMATQHGTWSYAFPHSHTQPAIKSGWVRRLLKSHLSLPYHPDTAPVQACLYSPPSVTCTIATPSN